MGTTIYTVDLGLLGEKELEVEYDYSPGRPGCMYLSNGDPGYEAEAPEIEVTEVLMDNIDVTAIFSNVLEHDDVFRDRVFEREQINVLAERMDYEYERRREERYGL